MRTLGADFSYYDGGPAPYSTLNWKQYTWDFAFIKVSEGIVSDPLFEKQWAAARMYTVRSAYHFFRPIVDPKSSVERTIQILNGDLGELPLAFDLEDTDDIDPAVVMARAKTWLAWYEQYTGIRPIIYSSPNFLNSVVKAGNYPWLAHYKLWLAEYPFDRMSPDSARDGVIHDVLFGMRSLAFPAPPAPFKRVSFHQWTGRGNPADVPGYFLGYGHKLAVDLIFYNGSFEDMSKEFNLEATDPTPPPTEEGPMTQIIKGKAIGNVTRRKSPQGEPFTPARYLVPGDEIEASGNQYQWLKLTKINGVPLTDEEWASAGSQKQYIQWDWVGVEEDPTTPPPVTKKPFTLNVDGFKSYSGELEPE